MSGQIKKIEDVIALIREGLKAIELAKQNATTSVTSERSSPTPESIEQRLAEIEVNEANKDEAALKDDLDLCIGDYNIVLTDAQHKLDRNALNGLLIIDTYSFDEEEEEEEEKEYSDSDSDSDSFDEDSISGDVNVKATVGYTKVLSPSNHSTTSGSRTPSLVGEEDVEDEEEEVFDTDAAKLAFLVALKSSTRPIITVVPDVSKLGGSAQNGAYYLEPDGLFQYKEDNDTFYPLFTVKELRGSGECASLLSTELKQLRQQQEAAALAATKITEGNILTLFARGLTNQKFQVTDQSAQYVNVRLDTIYLTPEGLVRFKLSSDPKYIYQYLPLLATEQLERGGWLKGFSALEEMTYDLTPDLDKTPVTLFKQTELPFAADADPEALYLTAQGLYQVVDYGHRKSFEQLLTAGNLTENRLLGSDLASIAPPTEVDAPTILAQLLQNETSVEFIMQATLPKANEAQPNTFYLTADGLFQIDAAGSDFTRLINAATLIRNNLLTEQLAQLREIAQPSLWAMRAVPTDIDAFKATLPDRRTLTAQNHIVTPQGLYQYNEGTSSFEQKKDQAELHDLDFTGQQLYAAADMDAATQPGYYLTPQGLFELWISGDGSNVHKNKKLTFAQEMPSVDQLTEAVWGLYYLTPVGVYHASMVDGKVRVESLSSFNGEIGRELAHYCSQSATACISSEASIALRAALEQAVGQGLLATDVEFLSPIEQTLNDFLTGSARSEQLVVCEEKKLPDIDSVQPLLSPRFVINADGLFQLNVQGNAYQKTPVLTSVELTGLGITHAALFEACKSVHTGFVATKDVKNPQTEPKSYPVGVEQLAVDLRTELSQAIDAKNKDKGFNYTAHLTASGADAVVCDPTLIGLAPVVVKKTITLDVDDKRRLCQELAYHKDTLVSTDGNRLNQAEIALRPYTVLAAYPTLNATLREQASALRDRLQPIVDKLLEVTQFDARLSATALPKEGDTPAELTPEQVALQKLSQFKSDLAKATGPGVDASFTDVHAWHQQLLALEQDLHVAITGEIRTVQDKIQHLQIIAGELSVEDFDTRNAKPLSHSEPADKYLELSQLGELATLTTQLDRQLAEVEGFTDEQKALVKLSKLTNSLMPLTNLQAAKEALVPATASQQSIDPRVLMQILFGEAVVQSGLPDDVSAAKADVFYATAGGLFRQNLTQNGYDRVATAAQLMPWLSLSQALAVAQIDSLTVSDEKPSLMAEGQTYLYLSRDDGYSDPVLEKSTSVIHGLVSVAEQESARTLTQLFALNDDLYLAASVESMVLVDEQSPRWLMTPAGLFEREGLEEQDEEEWLTTYSYSGSPVLSKEQLINLGFTTLLTEAGQEAVAGHSIQKEVPISKLYALQKALDSLLKRDQCHLVNDRQYSLAQPDETVAALESRLHTEKAKLTTASLNLAALRAMTALCDRAVDFRVQNTTETSKLVAASVTQQALFLQVAPFLVHGNAPRVDSKRHRISQLARLVEEHIKQISDAGPHTQASIKEEIAALTQLKAISDTCDQALAKIKTADAFLARGVIDKLDGYWDGVKKEHVDGLFEGIVKSGKVALPENFEETCTAVIAKAQQELHVTQQRQLDQLALRFNGYTTVKVIAKGTEVPALAARDMNTLYVQALALKPNAQALNTLSLELGDGSIYSIAQPGSYQPYAVYTSAKEKPDVLREGQARALGEALGDAEGTIEGLSEVNSIAVACGVGSLKLMVANSKSVLLNQELARLQQSLTELTLESPDFTQQFTQLQGEIERLDHAVALCQVSGYTPEDVIVTNEGLDAYPEALRDKLKQEVLTIQEATQEVTKSYSSKLKYSFRRPAAGLQDSLDKGPINAKTVPILMQRIDGYRVAVAEAAQNANHEEEDSYAAGLLYRLRVIEALSSLSENYATELSGDWNTLIVFFSGVNNNNITPEQLRQIDSRICQWLEKQYAAIYQQLAEVNLVPGQLGSWPKDFDGLDLDGSVDLLEQLSFQLLSAKSQQLSEVVNPNNGGSDVLNETLSIGISELLNQCRLGRDPKDTSLVCLPLRQMPYYAELIQQADEVITSMPTTSSMVPVVLDYAKDFPNYVEQYWQLTAYGEKDEFYNDHLERLLTALEGMRDATTGEYFAGKALVFQQEASKIQNGKVYDKGDVEWFTGDRDITDKNFDEKFLVQYPRVASQEPIKQAISAHLCDHIVGANANPSAKVVAMLDASNRLMDVIPDGKPHGFYQTTPSVDDAGFLAQDRRLTAVATTDSLTVTAISKQAVLGGPVAKDAIMTSAVTLKAGAFATTTTIPTVDLKLSADDAAKLAAREDARTIYDSLWAQNLAAAVPKSIAQFREFIGTQNYRVDTGTLRDLEANQSRSGYDKAALLHAQTLNAELEKLGFGEPSPAPTFIRVATVVTAPIVPTVNVVHIDEYQPPLLEATVGGRGIGYQDQKLNGMEQAIIGISELPPSRSRVNSMASTSSNFDADSLFGDGNALKATIGNPYK